MPANGRHLAEELEMYRLIGVAWFVLLSPVFVAAGAWAQSGQGTFSGASGHATSGGVTIAEGTAGYEVRLQENFSFDGAPDPRVTLGSGTALNAVDLGELASKKGAQVYSVPAGTDPARFDKIVIYCRKYSVPLGIADLKR